MADNTLGTKICGFPIEIEYSGQDVSDELKARQPAAINYNFENGGFSRPQFFRQRIGYIATCEHTNVGNIGVEAVAGAEISQEHIIILN